MDGGAWLEIGGVATDWIYRDVDRVHAGWTAAQRGEADFQLAGATKVVARGDAAYVSGCLFRVVGLSAHAIHAHAGRWLINEKGAITAADALPGAPTHFAPRAHHLLGHLGSTDAALRSSMDDARVLVDEVRAACA